MSILGASVLGVAVTLPLIAISIAVSALPVWLAAKVVGAGRQEFWRVALALVLAWVLAIVLLVVGVKLIGGWTLLLVPVVFLGVFSKMLEVSYLGAFVLCILAAAFQVVISKVFGAMLGA